MVHISISLSTMGVSVHCIVISLFLSVASSSLQMYSVEEAYHVELFKRQLLEELDMTTVPPATRRSTDLPEPLVRQVNEMNQMYDYTEDPRAELPEKIFLSSVSPCSDHDFHVCLGFDLTTLQRPSEILKAELWLQLPNERANRTLVLSEVPQSGFSGVSRQYSVHLTEDQWARVDIKPSLVAMVFGGTAQLQMMLYCSLYDSSSSCVNGLNGSKTPFLITKTKPRRSRTMRKRNGKSAEQYCFERRDEYCCRTYALSVNFTEIGMEFIQHPKNISTAFCFGACSQINSHTMHSEMIQKIRGRLDRQDDHEERYFLSPCCAPVKFRNMSFLYTDEEGNLVQKNFPLRVERCGCL